MGRDEINADVVAGLVAGQFPQWAALPLSRVELDGWDNTTFRLGSSMSVRLPTADRYVAQIDKEHRWLPVLAGQLPAQIPMPLARGLDFGCCAVGDPACDLTIAWTFFTGESRQVFKSALPVEASAWARGRGWALWKALRHLSAQRQGRGEGQPSDSGVGWRVDARAVIGEVIEDQRSVD